MTASLVVELPRILVWDGNIGRNTCATVTATAQPPQPRDRQGRQRRGLLRSLVLAHRFLNGRSRSKLLFNANAALPPSRAHVSMKCEKFFTLRVVCAILSPDQRTDASHIHAPLRNGVVSLHVVYYILCLTRRMRVMDRRQMGICRG